MDPLEAVKEMEEGRLTCFGEALDPTNRKDRLILDQHRLIRKQAETLREQYKTLKGQSDLLRRQSEGMEDQNRILEGQNALIKEIGDVREQALKTVKKQDRTIDRLSDRAGNMVVIIGVLGIIIVVETLLLLGP